jgi:uncharacterized protein
MIHKLWINLPVKNVAASVNFFTQLGFEFNTEHSIEEQSACMIIGTSNTVVMLFEEQLFNKFSGNENGSVNNGASALFSFDAESNTEIDTLAQKVTKAGGKVYSPPSAVQGWMYGFGFADLDGHKWNALYMNMNNIPKQ